MKPQQSRQPLARRSDGKLWNFTEFGSYVLIYLTRDDSVLCSDCANGENDSEACEGHEDAQWDIVAASGHQEGAPLECDHCNCEIPSDYGDPDNPEGAS